MGTRALQNEAHEASLTRVADRVPSGTTPARVQRVGAGPIERVCLIENHDEAYYIWREAGIGRRTLVHIDAHHDMWWVEEGRPVTIGNFICPALKQDLVQKIYWIVPDAAFDDTKSRRPILRHLKQIRQTYPASAGITVEDRRITTSVLGKKLTICPLLSLPKLGEPVLLDIDVDYLVIPRVSDAKSDQHGLLPWCWPDELVQRLHDAGIRSDLVTVACSIEGGYTPLQWKYLGEELTLLLKGPLGRGPALAGMHCLREGAEAEQRGQTNIAEVKYRRAQALLPNSAAAPYRLARLLASLGRVEKGRRLYAHAVELDGSYEGAYSSGGFHCYWSGAREAAEREFRDLLALNPRDAHALLGLGLLAQERRLWKEAERHLRGALALDNCLLDAQRALGNVMAKLGRTKEAIAAYEQVLKLGLAGHQPLDGPIVSDAAGRPVLDPGHFATHARSAALYAQEGATEKAIDGFRIAIAGKCDSASIRLRLAGLYWRQGQWGKLAAQAWQAIRMTPRDIYFNAMRHLRRMLRFAQDFWDRKNVRP